MNLPESRDSLIIQDLPEYFSTMNIDKHIHQTLSYDLKVLSARKVNHCQGFNDREQKFSVIKRSFNLLQTSKTSTVLV